MFGVGPTTARSYILKSGIETRISYGKHNKKFSDEFEDKIVQLYNDGISIERIADQLGVDYATTRLTLIRRNVTLRPMGGGTRKLTLDDEKEICKNIALV